MVHDPLAMNLWPILAGPTYALPLDIFRVLVGLLTLGYFARTWREAPLFSGPDGLLDHALQRELLPFTRLTLFPPRASLRLLRTLYAFGCAAAVLLVLGIAVQASALTLYVLAVSTYRWNFLLMYVDDAIIHLTLFWMVLLPVGETLTLPGFLSDPTNAWSTWQTATVPGLAVRCFLLNLGLVYVVAGLWKWTSPMWRRGMALHASLQMAVAYRPSAWGPDRSTALRFGNYFALVIEPALALLLIAPAHSPMKLILAAGAIAFHVGIIVTMKFPFANLAMLGALVVMFSPELMGLLGSPPLAAVALPVTPFDALAIGVVGCLVLLFLLNGLWYRGGSPTQWRLGATRHGINPFYIPLWAVGLAQSYRLFDWIDERNYHVDYELVEVCPESPPQRIESTVLFPRSMRHILLQSYLHGNIWVQLDPDRLPALRATILTRYARVYCRTHPTPAAREVHAIVQRLTPDNLDLHRGEHRPLMRFSNENGATDVTGMLLTPRAPG